MRRWRAAESPQDSRALQHQCERQTESLGPMPNSSLNRVLKDRQPAERRAWRQRIEPLRERVFGSGSTPSCFCPVEIPPFKIDVCFVRSAPATPPAGRRARTGWSRDSGRLLPGRRAKSGVPHAEAGHLEVFTKPLAVSRTWITPRSGVALVISSALASSPSASSV